MKKLFISVLSLMLLLGSVSFAQLELEEKEGSSVKPFNFDLNIGARLGTMENSPGTDWESSVAGMHFDFGFRYMFVDLTGNDFLNLLGVKLDFGYDGITSSSATEDKKTTSNLLRFGGHGIINLDPLFTSDVFGVNLHGGLGVSLLSNNENSTLTDKMLNYIIGATPSYKINENISVNMNFSLIFLSKLDRGVDMIEYIPGAPVEKGTAAYSNISVGITYSL